MKLTTADEQIEGGFANAILLDDGAPRPMPVWCVLLLWILHATHWRRRNPVQRRSIVSANHFAIAS